ncbi:MAG: hypothetical protein GF349_01275 [Candidatus Magasanikbacteria bacterium]|nr:hypothetical protein [Candidatus Magasanikbacteria bacterium]
MKIKKCTNCGSRDFYIQETICHKATLLDNGRLETYKDAGNGIEKITCGKCETEYNENDFENIKF